MRRTPTTDSSSSSRSRLTALVASGLISLPTTPAAAQPDGEAPTQAQAPSIAATTDTEPTPLPKVRIVVVGGRLPASLLEATLGAQARDTFALDYGTAARFGPQDLFRARIEASADIHVWVDTTTPGVVRLYFVNRDGTRYLVRTMELSDQMDEMDREALAQAIEWSLSALVEGTAGMTREEAESLLQPPAPEPVPVTPPPAATPPPVAPRPWRHQRRGWLPEVASFYGVAGHSDQVPVTHGPGLRFGLDRITRDRQLGFAGSAQYQFPQRREDERVALELRTLALRFELRAAETDLFPGTALLASVRAGLDLTQTSAEARDAEAFAAEPTRTSLTPLLAGGIAGQFRLAPVVRLELGLGLEVDLTRVHYDLTTESGSEHFVSRWPVRPTGTLGIEFW